MELTLQVDKKNSIIITVEELSNNRKRISVPIGNLGTRKARKLIKKMKDIDIDFINKLIISKKSKERKTKLIEIWKI